jgi:hypothetical protein
MTEHEKPRSAVEIALDRMKQRDAASGATDPALSDEQKAAIGEARSVRAAKAAELEILHRSKMAVAFDPADRQRLEGEYHNDLRRLNDECDRKVRNIRADRD